MNNFDVLPGLYKCTHRIFDGTPDGKLLFEEGNIYKCLSKHDKAEFEVSYGHSVYLEDPVVYRHFIPFIEQDDPKPTDTVEPEFEVGDWIYHNNGYRGPYLITNINKYRVELDNNIRIKIEDCYDYHHLWTIHDAKDGDVLAEDTCIFILKKLNQDLSAKIYCCLYDDGEFDDLTSNLVFDDTCTYPATAEQRDTLFAKMREAGYEWDSEKKELRKLEQKPTDKIRPKFKVGDRIIKSSRNSCSVHSSTDDTICEVAEVHDTCYILNTGEGRIQVPLEWQDHYELVKPTWSEEDENNINSIVSRLEVDISYWESRSKTRTNEDKKLIDWLKSLKELVKNKKENETNKLSEEDINNLNRISTILYKAGQVQCWWKEERLIPKEESDYLCDWLKSLYNKLKL